MPGVRIVCDSTADLERDFREVHGVRVVPLKVIFGDEVFEDGETIQAADFYARMRASAVHPRTSQPTPAEFEEVFRDVGRDGSTIVCTTISANLSGTYTSAVQARAALPDQDIRVIDTRSVAVGHNAVVHEAAAAATSGGDAAAVEAAVHRVIDTQQLLFTVETLEYLRRGGRIGGARALLGSMLDIKPILEIRDGVIEPVDRVRTYQRALDHIAKAVRTASREWGGADVVVGHGDHEAVASALVEKMRPWVTPGDVILVDVGPVIGCHSGPGAIGVGYRPLAPGRATK